MDKGRAEDQHATKNGQGLVSPKCRASAAAIEAPVLKDRQSRQQRLLFSTVGRRDKLVSIRDST